MGNVLQNTSWQELPTQRIYTFSVKSWEGTWLPVCVGTPPRVPAPKGSVKSVRRPKKAAARSSAGSEGQPTRLGALNSRAERGDRVCGLREDCLSTAFSGPLEGFDASLGAGTHGK